MARLPSLIGRQLVPASGCLMQVSSVRWAVLRFSNHVRPLSKLALLATIGLVLDWIAQVWQWSSVSLEEIRDHGITRYSASAGDSSLPTYLSYLALALFVTAGVLNAWQSRRWRIPILIPLFLYVIVTCGTFWLIVGFTPSEYRFALGNGGPLTFLMCAGVFSGFDATLWPVLRRIALLIAYAAIALGLYYSLQLSVIGKFEGTTPMNQHMPTAFWFALYVLLSTGPRGWKGNWVALIPIALCIPIAILMSSRSMALLPALALALGLVITFKRNICVSPVKTIVLGLFAMSILGLGMWVFIIAMPEQVERFTARLGEDTRSSQYGRFFEQVPIVSLVTGLGPKATYVFNDKTNYSYIDNQFLFILFRYGIPMLFAYCAIVLWPGLLLLSRGSGKAERLLGFYSVFWILAMLGLSIFHGVVNNPANLLAVLVAGRCFDLMLSKGKRPSPPVAAWGYAGDGIPYERNRVEGQMSIPTASGTLGQLAS